MQIIFLVKILILHLRITILLLCLILIHSLNQNYRLLKKLKRKLQINRSYNRLKRIIYFHKKINQYPPIKKHKRKIPNKKLIKFNQIFFNNQKINLEVLKKSKV